MVRSRPEFSIPQFILRVRAGLIAKPVVIDVRVDVVAGVSRNGLFAP